MRAFRIEGSARHGMCGRLAITDDTRKNRLPSSGRLGGARSIRTRGISRRIAYRAVTEFPFTTKIGHSDFAPGDGLGLQDAIDLGAACVHTLGESGLGNKALPFHFLAQLPGHPERQRFGFHPPSLPRPECVGGVPQWGFFFPLIPASPSCVAAPIPNTSRSRDGNVTTPSAPPTNSSWLDPLSESRPWLEFARRTSVPRSPSFKRRGRLARNPI